MPKVKIERKTKETEIALSLDLGGSGKSDVKSGVGFFDHMLELFAYHGCFDLEVRCTGDLHVDDHHSVEDIGICLGQAFRQSAPQSKGIVRYATAFVPMDESLARAVVDVSGRPHLIFDAEFARPTVGEFATELVREFFQAFANHAQITLHLKVEYGTNTHHCIEALFKAAAVALRQAIQPDANRKGPTSTKGIL